jgi:hypothetical protein
MRAPKKAFYPRQYIPEVEITLPSEKEVPAIPEKGKKHWSAWDAGI